MREATLQLKLLVDPLRTPPWTDCKPISVEEILGIPSKYWIPSHTVSRGNIQTRADHMRRIAWLVAHKDSKPITFMRSWLCKWPVKDGNHRLAAAIVRGDTTIKVNFR